MNQPQPERRPDIDPSNERVLNDMEFIVDLLAAARERGASDLHVDPTSVPWMRIDGKMLPIVGRGRPSDGAIDSFCAKILSDDGMTRLKGARGSAGGRYDGNATGPVRAQAYNSMNGFNLALRLLPETVPKLAELGLPSICADFPGYRNGLVLFTGETGAGKTTALAAVIDRILDNWDGFVLTFEDPVEVLHKNVDDAGKLRKSRIEQIEIGLHADSYADALRSALRSDFDALLVGEMRDRETIQATLEAAQTGHLVFSTGHDQRAAKTIERLVGAFPPEEADRIRYGLANVIRAIVSLRLLPHARGRGRVSVAEVLVMSDGIRELVVNNKLNEIPGAISQGSKEKMQTLERALAVAVARGQITQAVAKGETEKHPELEAEIKRAQDEAKRTVGGTR